MNVSLPNDSRQLLVVTATDWSSTSGQLRLMEKQHGQWKLNSDVVEVSIGRNGLADDKREGDGKSPAGIFRLSSSFGYADVDSASWIRLPYVQATASMVCVDDSASHSYNQIVDGDSIPEKDWSSAEQMLIDHQYKWGIVVDYNQPPAPGRGSCIFLHIWKEPGHPTAGCTAMSEQNLVSILRWLDPAKHPVLVQYPIAEYNTSLDLPQL